MERELNAERMEKVPKTKKSFEEEKKTRLPK